MKNQKKNMKRYIALFLLIIASFSIVSMTYAWFTSNQIVNTNLVRTKTDEDEIGLYVSNDEITWIIDQEVEISKISIGDVLMPVSTSDLKTFLYCTNQGEEAKEFEEDIKEEYFYHGRIYLKAQSSNSNSNKKLDLYLSDEKELFNTNTPEILKASRLALIFNDKEQYIFNTSDKINDGISNTVLNGNALSSHQVLTKVNGSIEVKEDPAQSLELYVLHIKEEEFELPLNYLLEMNMNEEYTVDIYFYLEGCDPDCTQEIAYQEVLMNLCFYGVVGD